MQIPGSPSPNDSLMCVVGSRVQALVRKAADGT